MKRLVFLFLLLPLFLFSESSVWKIQKRENIVYIGGTVHMLRDSDFPLPLEYKKAYEKSDKLYFETDLSGMNSPEIQNMLLSKMVLKQGETLSSILSKDSYKMLENYCQKYSINIKDFEHFKPAMPVLMITVSEFHNVGFKDEGVDIYFERMAKDDNKDIGQLETVEEQINYVTSFGEGNEDNFVIQSLKDLDKVRTLFPKIVVSWKKGDTKDLQKALVDDMKRDYPKLYESIIVERNNNWIPMIKSMFNDKKTEFVLVGTAHLIGNDGVIEQLKRRGFLVEKVK